MDYKKLTNSYKEEMLKNISKFVEIDSVYDESSKDEQNPFGKGVSNALAFIENLAKEDGFEVNNYNNMVVEILVGSGDKNITRAEIAKMITNAENIDTANINEIVNEVRDECQLPPRICDWLTKETLTDIEEVEEIETEEECIKFVKEHNLPKDDYSRKAYFDYSFVSIGIMRCWSYGASCC